jgi:hypothetical protein
MVFPSVRTVNPRISMTNEQKPHEKETKRFSETEQRELANSPRKNIQGSPPSRPGYYSEEAVERPNKDKEDDKK